MIAAGTWQYNASEVESSLQNAFSVGFRMIDTAHDYNNEEAVGRALATSGRARSDLFLETKVPGCGIQGISMFKCYEDTKNMLDDNLKLLNVSYVDLVIIHFPPLGTMISRTCGLVCHEVQDQWRALEEFYKAGKAKAIGVSNYCTSCFRCLESTASVMPMVNQVAYHLGMGTNPGGMKTLADKYGFVLQAYSPLGNLPWKKGANPELLKGNFTTGLAQAHNKSTIQVALKWLVQHGIATITKSGNPVHLAEDLDLWSWNLTDAEMKAADEYHLFGMPSFACNFEEDSLDLVV